jgi:23S rRNA (adenine2503-C2)-methyltransferase
MARAHAFCQVLHEAGISCTIRARKGIEIEAGCGQLATEDDSEA